MGAAAMLVGAIIDDKYRVECVLGQGGMGVIVAARHLRLGQLVAIKFPSSTAQRRDDTVERLLREGRAAMRIRSEHAAKVHDVGLHEGIGPYLVMEYLIGRDLGKVLAESGPISVTSAVEYVLQASEAVAEAHAKGIVHRDLKPSNLFLSRRADGAPLIKVIDFGLAKTSAEDRLSLTNSGAMLGSLLFMAPEQMRGSAAVDARADIWGLGATLYTLLVGHPPFPGKNPLDVYDRIKFGPPEITTLRPEIGTAVEQVLLGCLKVDPSERHSNVAELAEALLKATPAHVATYAHRIPRVLESARGEASLEGDRTHSRQAALAADLDEVQATEPPLSASWIEEPADSQRERAKTDASPSLWATARSTRGARTSSLLTAVAMAAMLGGVGATISLVRTATTTEKIDLQSRDSAIVAPHAGAAATTTAPSLSDGALQTDPPQEPPTSRPILAPVGSSRAATSASVPQRRSQGSGSPRAAEAVRDPLAEPD